MHKERAFEKWPLQVFLFQKKTVIWLLKRHAVHFRNISRKGMLSSQCLPHWKEDLDLAQKFVLVILCRLDHLVLQNTPAIAVDHFGKWDLFCVSISSVAVNCSFLFPPKMSANSRVQERMVNLTRQIFFEPREMWERAGWSRDVQDFFRKGQKHTHTHTNTFRGHGNPPLPRSKLSLLWFGHRTLRIERDPECALAERRRPIIFAWCFWRCLRAPLCMQYVSTTVYLCAVRCCTCRHRKIGR